MSEKLQKILARGGLGSRREMEQWIDAGRVSINGKIAKLGDRAEEDDTIRVDGHILDSRSTAPARLRVIMYNKPEGEICSHHDPEGRPTVFDHLPNLRNSKWLSIGRLDFNTTGLLLFTNNGELANKMMHPSSNLEREYAVRVFGPVDDAMLDRLREGVQLEDGFAKFERIVPAGGEGRNQWFHVIIKEGRNREVRRLWESQEVSVSRLTRIRFGDITLPRTIPVGRWAEMEGAELKALLAGVGMEKLMPKTVKKKSKRKSSAVPRTQRAKPSPYQGRKKATKKRSR
jgi:23S rRNA pseudouridine2605 synthase